MTIRLQTNTECKDTLADFVFLIDVSGSVQYGFEVQKKFIIQVLDNAIPVNSGVGVILFGGTVSVLTRLSDNKPHSQIRSDLQNMPFVGGGTAMGDAVRLGLDWLSNSTKPNKRILMATDGRPNGGSIPDPCSMKEEIANMDGLSIVILGISDGFNPNAVSCLVQKESKPNDYIIQVAGFDSTLLDRVLPDLDDQFCPSVSCSVCFSSCTFCDFPGSFQLKITEIKLPSSAGGQTAPAFFEIVNQGVDNAPLRYIGVNGLFSSRLASITSNKMLLAGQVAVVYDHTVGVIPTCPSCSCNKTVNNTCDGIVYVPCGNRNVPCFYTGQGMVRLTFPFCDLMKILVCSSSQNTTNFFVELSDWSGSTSPANGGTISGRLIDVVRFDTKTLWPVVSDGHSLELKKWTLSNNEGINWAESCDLAGTPGDVPITNCTSRCFPSRCRSGGDLEATCQTNSTTCSCTGQYYVENGVCITRMEKSGEFCGTKKANVKRQYFRRKNAQRLLLKYHRLYTLFNSVGRLLGLLLAQNTAVSIKRQVGLNQRSLKLHPSKTSQTLI